MSLSFTKPKSLGSLYALAYVHPKARGNKHVRAKIRQVLYMHPEMFVETEPGYWTLAAHHSPEQVKMLQRAREKRLRQHGKTKR